MLAVFASNSEENTALIAPDRDAREVFSPPALRHTRSPN
jgi:hypothetical protein